MMYVPINCAIVVDLFKEHKGKPPQTLTEVYTALTNTLLRRHEKKTKEKAQWPGPCILRHNLSVCEDEIQQRDLITKRKNEVLINAVEAQVTTDPSKFQAFMEVFERGTISLHHCEKDECFK
eukprot:Em0002g713a